MFSQPHLAECVYIIVKCPQGCDVEFEKRFTEKHVAEDCNNRPIECEFCHDKLPYIQEIEHLNQCAMFPLPCPNGCKKKDILRKDVIKFMLIAEMYKYVGLKHEKCIFKLYIDLFQLYFYFCVQLPWRNYKLLLWLLHLWCSSVKYYPQLITLDLPAFQRRFTLFWQTKV